VKLGDVVSALASVVTFGGYVLVVGAVVAWLDIRTIGVPAISVVADMPRNELFGLGLETLGVWLLLGLIIAIAIVGIRSTVQEDPLLPLITLVLSTVISGLVAGIWQIDSTAISVVATVVLGAPVIFGIFRTRDQWADDELLPIVIASGAGAVLGVGLELLLINSGRIVGFIAALLILMIIVWFAVEMFWRREVVGEGPYYISGVPFIQKKPPKPPSDPKARRAALLRSSRRSIVAVVLLAVVLALGAIESRKSHDFWVARVTMTNGTCASGTLLVRNSNEVLLAVLMRKVANRQIKDGFVEIPASIISNVQVIGPPGALRQVKAESCANAVRNTPPGPFAPYPLVDESSASEVDPPVSAIPGPEGKEGKRGPKGERGSEGTEGRRGPEGKRGPTGRSGATGQTGAQGEPGPRGHRGERGPRGRRGERGPMGPRGFSSVDGS